jgi:hypothetical protein
MNILNKIIIAVSLILATTGCDEFLAPDKDNIYTESEILRDPSMAEGILLNAYSSVPNATLFTEVATDDAVSNDNSNSYRLASNGEWKSTNNPFNVWSGSYTNIGYTNLFLSIVDKVQWSPRSEWKNEQYKRRLAAEAYALRAFYQFRLLQAHAGPDAQNNMLGFPIVNDLIKIDDNWQSISRSTYQQCVDQILLDLDAAIPALPDTYTNSATGDSLKAEKDAVYGSRFANRINRRVAQMLKARTLLHAASPAFNTDNSLAKWEAAANVAAEIINSYGGLNALSASRNEFYLSENNPDILWRKDFTNSRTFETDHFPPSLFGNGRLNPTQNLVDAFPTVSGYPINNAASGYDIAKPFTNRDPRLARFILFNGSVFKNTTINTIDGARDGINMIAGSSTRTGYYMKKLLSPNVSLTPGNIINQRRFHTLMRYTEAFLIYAESANEAWGPDGKGNNSFSAREVIAKIRNTAGITNDGYLPTINDKESMRALIRNERRLELSFEGFRFWDIRRWNDLNSMKEVAKGTADGGISSFEVEKRVFEDYMIYGPIPDSEYRKGLTQNKGW